MPYLCFQQAFSIQTLSSISQPYNALSLSLSLSVYFILCITKPSILKGFLASDFGKLCRQSNFLSLALIHDMSYDKALGFIINWFFFHSILHGRDRTKFQISHKKPKCASVENETFCEWKRFFNENDNCVRWSEN